MAAVELHTWLQVRHAQVEGLPSTRRNILRWIAGARTPPTRNRRIELTASEAARGVRVRSNG